MRQSFPTGFLWGAATSAHQVEGDNDNTDWWDWEQADDPPIPLAEPSGSACDHWTRYRSDITLLAELGLNAYRFSVEWSRIEPVAGTFDRAVLDHYRDVVAACLECDVTPIVTLQHFTLPRWVAARGGWTAADIGPLFARYTRRVAESLGAGVPYYCTINEPGNMLTRGYLGIQHATPPFLRSMDQFERAVAGVATAHRYAREALKDVQPEMRVGMAHALQDWRASPAAQPLMRWARSLHEDHFFADVAGDDFIGVQTYTRVPVDVPARLAALSRLMLKSRFLTEKVLLSEMRRRAAGIGEGSGAERNASRRTDMGYEWAPAAVEATARRVAELFPRKELLITEHGVGTEDDGARIAYVEEGIRAIGRLLADELPVSGYIHWSLMDNWEWWDGFRPRFGLVAVDRSTQERTIKPSGHWYGAVAKANSLEYESRTG